ncbi:MAG: phosphatase PAP2 family protein [Bulleidia sp.]
MSYSGFYHNITRPFVGHPAGVTVLKVINRTLTLLYYVFYPLFLVWMYMRDVRTGMICTLVPACGFVLCTVMRRVINAPRPYEAESITPLIRKNTVHRSFPSRHCFSAMVISCTAAVACVPLGIVLGCLAVVEGGIRIIGGVHYPRDIIAGLLLGALCGAVYLLF